MSVTGALYRLSEPPGIIFTSFTFDNPARTATYLVGMSLPANDAFTALGGNSARYHLLRYVYWGEITKVIQRMQNIRACD